MTVSLAATAMTIYQAMVGTVIIKAHEKWDTAVADNDSRSGSCDQQSKIP